MKELARVTELSRRGNRFEPRRVTSQPGFLASHASGSHARPNPLGGSCKLAGPSPHPGDSVWMLGCRTKQPGFCHAARVEQRGPLPYCPPEHLCPSPSPPLPPRISLSGVRGLPFVAATQAVVEPPKTRPFLLHSNFLARPVVLGIHVRYSRRIIKNTDSWEPPPLQPSLRGLGICML